MSGKTILVCPLDWGLGHASRCIPLIREWIAKGERVIIGADKGPAILLKQEFPQLEHLVFPGLEIIYPENGNFFSYMLKAAPQLIAQTKAEEKWIQQMVDKYKVDMVVSDNRYGARSSQVHSIFITHQLFVRGTPYTRFLEPIIKYLTWNYIRKYDECWVPDVEGTPNLAGELSHGDSLPLPNTKYIGILSRFQGMKEENPGFPIPSLLAVLSGPEPLRTRLEEKLISQCKANNLEILIIRGKPGEPELSINDSLIRIVSHLPTAQLLYCLNHCKTLIARSGYSTLMDIQYTQTPALLIPTPGQTEQEYLARYYEQLGWYAWQSQEELNLSKDLKRVKEFSPPGIK